MDRFIVIDAPSEALDDLEHRLAKENIEYHSFICKDIGVAGGLAIACSVVNLAKLIWDWYGSWHARRAGVEVQVTLYPDNITLKLSPNKRVELEVLIRPENVQNN